MFRLFYSLRPEEKQFGEEAGRELFRQIFFGTSSMKVSSNLYKHGEGSKKLEKVLLHLELS